MLELAEGIDPQNRSGDDFWLLDVSSGYEDIGEQGGEQVDDGDVGSGVSVSAGTALARPGKMPFKASRRALEWDDLQRWRMRSTWVATVPSARRTGSRSAVGLRPRPI